MLASAWVVASTVVLAVAVVFVSAMLQHQLSLAQLAVLVEQFLELLAQPVVVSLSSLGYQPVYREMFLLQLCAGYLDPFEWGQVPTHQGQCLLQKLHQVEPCQPSHVSQAWLWKG